MFKGAGHVERGVVSFKVHSSLKKRGFDLQDVNSIFKRYMLDSSSI